jgi:hypothetical protein
VEWWHIATDDDAATAVAAGGSVKLASRVF